MTDIATPTQGPPVKRDPRHTDYIERLDSTFYIRWTSGPNYERAFICVEDDEPDMNDIATVSFGRAEGFRSWYRRAMRRNGLSSGWGHLVVGLIAGFGLAAAVLGLIQELAR